MIYDNNSFKIYYYNVIYIYIACINKRNLFKDVSIKVKGSLHFLDIFYFNFINIVLNV